MFKKILIANRGEIAVRIVRACREMGIGTVALYEPSDKSSLHIRLADECVMIDSPADFFDQTRLIAIAQERGADAIHPGYGFLAEEASFIRACGEAGIAFIGPSAEVVETVRDKIGALQKAKAAGIPTVTHSAVSFGEGELELLLETAESIGYPLVIKSCSGGRGVGEKLVRSPEKLAEAVRRAQAEAQAVYGSRRVYLEKAILPAHQVNVQIVADKYGRIVHLGDREGSLQVSSRKLLEESPAPCLSEEQRHEVWRIALELARLFNYQNVGTVEFLVNGDGQFYFTEFKSRLQVEHPLTEMMTKVNLVREQIRVAAGEQLAWTQEQIHIHGHAMLCRIHAEDPWNHYLPSPGRLRRVRWPGGYCVRVDTYVQRGSNIPEAYDPLIAKLTTWGSDRQLCLLRMRCALEDAKLTGTTTNLPLLQRLMHAPDFIAGRYDSEFLVHPFGSDNHTEEYFRDLAAITAVLYLRRNQTFQPTVPERLHGGWHRASRDY